VRDEFIDPFIEIYILLTAIASLFKLKMSLISEAGLVFGLGLFHGLGFASAMASQLQGQRFPISSLVGFNLGVEAGQLAVCLILGVLFEMLKRSSQWLEKVRILSIWAGFVAGGFWLFERI
jgi:hypothetical protein